MRSAGRLRRGVVSVVFSPLGLPHSSCFSFIAQAKRNLPSSEEEKGRTCSLQLLRNSPSTLSALLIEMAASTFSSSKLATSPLSILSVPAAKFLALLCWRMKEARVKVEAEEEDEIEMTLGWCGGGTGAGVGVGATGTAGVEIELEREGRTAAAGAGEEVVTGETGLTKGGAGDLTGRLAGATTGVRGLVVGACGGRERPGGGCIDGFGGSVAGGTTGVGGFDAGFAGSVAGAGCGDGALTFGGC